VLWTIFSAFATKEKYFYCDPTYLDWSYRRKAILETLQSTQPSPPDIICLQEVSTDSFEVDFAAQPVLGQNYTFVLQTVTPGHEYANAVLVNSAKLRVLRSESRSRALIVVLQEVDTINPTTLYLVNVHLEAGRDHDETRFCQVKSLLKRLRNHVLLDQQQGHTVEDPCILIAGDFNMLQDNPVHHLLSTGEWVPAKSRQPRSRSFQSKQSPVAIRETNGIPLLQRRFPFLPVREIHQDCVTQRRNNQGMTYSGGAVLDYIWVSESLRWKSAVPWVVNNAVLQPRTRRQAWPDKNNPSDHLPIGCCFSFRK
jgi:mRNA deadenylase 3'-5' endonuclease subunit Ccr4